MTTQITKEVGSNVLDVTNLGLSQRLEIPMPDVEARKAILKVHASKRVPLTNVDFKAIASVFGGCTGAGLR